MPKASAGMRTNKAPISFTGLLRMVIGQVLARNLSPDTGATRGLNSQGPGFSRKNAGFKRNRRAELKRSARRANRNEH